MGLDEIAREGARRILQAALEAEVAEYIDKNQAREDDGRALICTQWKGQAEKRDDRNRNVRSASAPRQ